MVTAGKEVSKEATHVVEVARTPTLSRASAVTEVKMEAGGLTATKDSDVVDIVTQANGVENMRPVSKWRNAIYSQPVACA